MNGIGDHRWKQFPGLLLSALFGLALSAYAHDPGLSTARVRIQPNQVEVLLTFARADLESLVPMDLDSDGKVSAAEFSAAKSGLEELAADAVEIRLDDQRMPPVRPQIRLDDNNNLQIQLHCVGRVAARLGVRSPLLHRLARGHRQFLRIEAADGRVLIERLLNDLSASCEIDSPASEVKTPATKRVGAFPDFLRLGIHHILTGYDHLLFLFALLLVCRDFTSAVKMISFFTVAHSITLAAAALDLVHIPGRLVEPAIAASIVYVGLENLVRREAPKGRWLLTFAFGLVHGFGFAGALREMGVAVNSTAVVVPLVSFNLGVELGQVAVCALVLPLIWRLRTNTRHAQAWVSASSAVVVMAGAYWMIERTFL